MISLLEDVKLRGNPFPLERSIKAEAVLDGHYRIVLGVEEEAWPCDAGLFSSIERGEKEAAPSEANQLTLYFCNPALSGCILFSRSALVLPC